MNFIETFKYGIHLLMRRNYYTFRRAVVWPEGEYKRGMLRRIQKLYNYKYFIETGTYLAETPLKLSSLFEHIWTIELDEKLFQKSQEKLVNYSNVTCIQGDSRIMLAEIVIKLDSPCLFWLDGHYSGSGTAMGEIKAPIIQELQSIGLSKIKSHLIVIDDISDFSAVENNAPISEVLRAIESINPNYKFYFDYDMLFALPFEKEHREFWKKAVYPIVVR